MLSFNFYPNLRWYEKKTKEDYIQTINLPLFVFNCLNKFQLSDSNGSHTAEKLS